MALKIPDVSRHNGAARPDVVGGSLGLPRGQEIARRLAPEVGSVRSNMSRMVPLVLAAGFLISGAVLVKTVADKTASRARGVVYSDALLPAAMAVEVKAVDDIVFSRMEPVRLTIANTPAGYSLGDLECDEPGQVSVLLYII